MKIVRFIYEKKIFYGTLNNYDASISFIDGSIFSDYTVLEDSVDIKNVKLLPPVSPSKVVCVGLNYREHAAEVGKSIPSEPVIFIKPGGTVIGDGDSIIYPSISKRVDYEAELCFIISSECKDISYDEAHNYILGYSCLNDVTARDLQAKDGQWTRAKGFDTFCPVGPHIETDIDISDIEIKAILNGEIKQQGRTSDFIFDVNECLRFISEVMTLNPGDIITTGTPSGIGGMSRGDTIQIEIEGIGTLTNYVK